MQMGPYLQPHPPVGAPPPGKKGGMRWARFLIVMGLAVLALSTLAVGCSSTRKLLRYQKFDQWPKATARYDGMSSKTTGNGRSRSTICTRWYKYTYKGRDMRAYADSPCGVVFGPDPEVGETIQIAYHPSNGRTCLSAVEVYAIGAYTFLAILLVGLSGFMVVSGTTIGIVSWARRRKRRPGSSDGIA